MEINSLNSGTMRLLQHQVASASTVTESMLSQKLQGLGDREQAEVVARQLESTFVQMLLSQMRQTVPESGLIEESSARKTFEGMLDQEYAQVAVGEWKFGFHEALVREIMRGGPQSAGAAEGPESAPDSDGGEINRPEP